MAIDAVLIGVLLLFGVLGLRAGAMSQLASWIGLALGCLGCGPAARALVPFLSPHVHVAPGLLKACLTTAFFYAFYLIANHIVFLVSTRMFADVKHSRWNSGFGFALGAGKGAAILFVLLSLALNFEKPLLAAAGMREKDVRRSRIISLVRKHGLFGEGGVPALTNIERLMKAAQSPSAARALANDPKFQALLDDPKMQAVLHDDRLAEALKSGNLAEVYGDPRVASILDDPKLTDEAAAFLNEGSSK